jgi:hypothetical protein
VGKSYRAISYYAPTYVETQSVYNFKNMHHASKRTNLKSNFKNNVSRQKCCLSLTNTYIKQITIDWKQTVKTGIKSACNKVIQTMIYADDQMIMDKSENKCNTPTEENCT